MIKLSHKFIINVEETKVKELTKVKNAVVISLGWLGDTLLNSSLCDNIKQSFPQAKLLFIAAQPFVEVAQGISSVDEVFYIDKKEEHKGFLGVFKFADEFKYKCDIDVAFVTHAHERSILLAKAIGAKRIVALPKKGFNPVNLLITDKYDRTLNELKNTYQADFNASYLTAVGVRSPKKDVNFSYPEEYDDIMRTRLQMNGLQGGDYVVLSPSSKDDFKDIDEEFGKLFLSCSKLPVVIIGTKKAQIFAQEMGGLNFIDMTNKTTIFELAALCKGAKSVVTVDTGTMHIAYAVGVKTICLFYKFDMIKQWLPQRRENVFLLKCTRDTTEKDVRDALALSQEF